MSRQRGKTKHLAAGRHHRLAGAAEPHMAGALWR
jgi:hypothetical protein